MQAPTLLAPTQPASPVKPRHTALVRVTHWLTVVAFLALLVSGLELVVSHPRFYLGETGNVNMHPLFTIPIPASRDTVPTGYDYVMPDQNGWSRYLHFQAAWAARTHRHLVYVISRALVSGHFRRDLIPPPAPTATWQAYPHRNRQIPASRRVATQTKQPLTVITSSSAYTRTSPSSSSSSR